MIDRNGNAQIKVRIPHLGVKVVSSPCSIARCREVFESGRHPMFTVFDLKPGDAIRAVAGPQTFSGHKDIMRAGGLPASAKPSRYDCECRFQEGLGPEATCACFPFAG